MRRERRAISDDAETITYTFHFQITNKGRRQACSVKVQAPNVYDAMKFFRQNWPMIESMARDGLVQQIWRRPDNQAGHALITGIHLVDLVKLQES